MPENVAVDAHDEVAVSTSGFDSRPLGIFLRKFKQLKAANFTQRRWWNVLSKNPPEGLEIEISPRNLTQTLCPAQPIMRITATTLQLRSA